MRNSKNQCKFFFLMSGATSLRELVKWTLIVLTLIATLFSPDSSGLAARLTEVLIKDLVGVLTPPAVSQTAQPDNKFDGNNPGKIPGPAAGAASGETEDLCPHH
jgi:hypothetical protein